MAERTPAQKKVISRTWIRTFLILLAVTFVLLITGATTGSANHASSGSGSGNAGSGVSILLVIAAISALGTLLAGVGAVVSSIAAVAAVRASGRQSATPLATTTPKGKKRRR